jgi:hypothetical protein
MTPAELRKLAEDIKKNGLRSHVTVLHTGSIADRNDFSTWTLLDGRNRLDAMELAGIRFEFRWKKGKEDWNWILTSDEVDLPVSPVEHSFHCDDPYAYVASVNIHRRHLTPEQKRTLISKLLKATPEKSDRQIAETVKASPTTVGTVRTKMEATGDVSKLDTRTDTKGRAQPAKKRSRKQPVEKSTRSPAARAADAIIDSVIDAAVASAKVKSKEREARALAEQDVGENITSENARLRVEIERLQNEKHRLELKVLALESENLDLKDQIARLEKVIASASAKPPEMPAALPPAPLEPLAPDDPGPIPDFLLRKKLH